MNTKQLQLTGEIYNKKELAAALSKPCPQNGAELEGLLFCAYQTWSAEMVKKLDGEFVMAITDRKEESTYLFRDPLGVYTLYYAVVGGKLVYSTELAKLLRYPELKPTMDREGICELLGLGPARTPGKTPIKQVKELLPGCYLKFHKGSIKEIPYWRLETKEHTLSEEETVEKGGFLLKEAMQKRLPKDEVAVLLSGGLDSSYLAALYKGTGREMKTFSLDFVGSQQYFVPNSFQPELDRPFVDRMVHLLGCPHKTILCDAKTQAAGLKRAMLWHGLPCMADIQTTLDYVCGEVGKENRYLMTGECADEIFGGYPWFHVPEYVNYEGFPWTYDLTPRTGILRSDLAEKIKLGEYVQSAYEKACRDVEYPEGESPEERVLRKNTYLTIYYFMQTLVRRTAVAVQHTGITPIVPFVDKELVEFAYNIPWEMKKKQGVRKYVLRQMAAGVLPEEIRNRPKSPYPKNYHPEYATILRKLWEEEKKGDCPVLELVDETVIPELLTEKGTKTPWFGQLMKGTQMVAYLYMVNEWMKEFGIKIEE